MKEKVNTLISNLESLLIFINYDQREDFLSEFAYTIISAGVDSKIVVEALSNESFKSYNSEDVILGIKVNEGW